MCSATPTNIPAIATAHHVRRQPGRQQQQQLQQQQSGGGGCPALLAERSCSMGPGRHPAWGFGLLILLLVANVEAQLVIRRNTQDCVYPAIAVDHFKLWPTKSYLPTGTTVSAIPGGWKVSGDDQWCGFLGAGRIGTAGPGKTPLDIHNLSLRRLPHYIAPPPPGRW